MKASGLCTAVKSTTRSDDPYKYQDPGSRIHKVVVLEQQHVHEREGSVRGGVRDFFGVF